MNNTNYDGSPSVWLAAIPWCPSEHQGRDYFDLGINIPAGTIPAQVTSAYPASVNGGFCIHPRFYLSAPAAKCRESNPNTHTYPNSNAYRNSNADRHSDTYPNSNALMFIMSIGLSHRRRMVAVVYSLSAEHLLR